MLDFAFMVNVVVAGMSFVYGVFVGYMVTKKKAKREGLKVAES